MTGGRSCHLSLEGEQRLPKEEGEVGTMSIPGCMAFVVICHTPIEHQLCAWPCIH